MHEHKTIKKGDSVIAGTLSGFVVDTAYGTITVRWYPLVPREWSHYTHSQIDTKIRLGHLEIRPAEQAR